MALQQVKAKIDKAPDTIGKDENERPNPALSRVGTTYEVSIDFPANMDEAITKWGSDTCFSRLMGAVTIDLQSAMRACIKSEDFSETALEKVAAAFAPMMRKAGVSFEAKIEDFIGDLSEEAIKELIERAQKKKADAVAA